MPEDRASEWYGRNRSWARRGPYTTRLPPKDEQAFQAWVKQHNVPFDPQDPASDYDMRGFWRGLQTGDPIATTAIDPNDQRLHYPDKWKTPYHETFSRESQYAEPDAPYWRGDALIDPRTGKPLFVDRPVAAPPTQAAPPSAAPPPSGPLQQGATPAYPFGRR